MLEQQPPPQPTDRPRTTTRYMTKYERARILGTRALQIRCSPLACSSALWLSVWQLFPFLSVQKVAYEMKGGRQVSNVLHAVQAATTQLCGCAW